MGMKEKRFRLNHRCTGKSGQVWGKWKFRKLPEVTKPHGTVTKIMLSIILSKSRLEVHYNFKKENMDFKTNLPLSDFALSRHWAILDLVKALEQGVGVEGGEVGGGGAGGEQRQSHPWPLITSMTSQKKERGSTSQVCWGIWLFCCCCYPHLIDFREKREKTRWCEKHQLVASHMRPDQELNLQPTGIRDDAPTTWDTWPGMGRVF